MTLNSETSSPSWVAVLSDGKMASDLSDSWHAISERVVMLKMYVDGKEYALPSGMDSYMQAKTMSSVVGSGEINIESRYIGFRHMNCEYYLRVDEHTRDVSVEIKEVI